MVDVNKNITDNDKNIVFTEDEFSDFDLDTIQGRADAVRLILSRKGYDESNDRQWMAHLLEGYMNLANSGLMPGVVRKMSGEELEYFHAGTYKAATLAPALDDYVALLHPMYSSMNPTLATDANFRITVGAWFYDPSIRGVERGTMIIHEVMHGVLGHYELSHLEPRKINLAGDAIINQQIERSDDQSLPSNFDNSDIFVFPRTIITKKYPKGMDNNESFMKYYAALEEDEDQKHGKSGNQSNSGQADGSSQSGGGQSQGRGEGDSSKQNGQGGGKSQGRGEGDSSKQNGQGGGQSQGQGGGDSSEQNGQGGGSYMVHDDGTVSKMDGSAAPCHEMSSEEYNSMDKEGVEKAGELEKEMARTGAQAKAMEQAKMRGNHGSDFNDFILDSLIPPKVQWEAILSNIISKSFNTIITGKTDFSYRRPNRRNHPNGFILPGSIAYAPHGIIGCDTSGSMLEKDYAEALGEVEGLCRSTKGSKLDFITVDTEITDIQPVSNAADLNLSGGGGTCMNVFYKYVNELPRAKRPDFTVLMTDAYIDWEESVEEMDPNIHNIILVTNEDGMDYAKEYDGKVQNLTVIPIY